MERVNLKTSHSPDYVSSVETVNHSKTPSPVQPFFCRTLEDSNNEKVKPIVEATSRIPSNHFPFACEPISSGPQRNSFEPVTKKADFNGPQQNPAPPPAPPTKGNSFSLFLKQNQAAATEVTPPATAAQSTMAATATAADPPIAPPRQRLGTAGELETLTNALTMSPEQKKLAEKFLSEHVIQPCKASAESTEQQGCTKLEIKTRIYVNNVIQPCKAPAESQEQLSFKKSDMEKRIDEYSPTNVSIITDENKKKLKDMLDGERNNVRTATLEEAIKGLLTHLLNIEEGQISPLTMENEAAATGLMKIQTTEGPDIVVKLSTQDEVNLNKKLETKFQGEDSPLVIPWGHFCIPDTDLVLLFMDEQGKDGLELINGALKNAIDSNNESLLVAVAKKLLIDGLTIINQMHKNGTLHRDPKLENLVLSFDGTLKKIDFSDVKVLKRGADSTECNTKKGSFRTYSHKRECHYTKSDDIEHFFMSLCQTLRNIKLEHVWSLEMTELDKLKAGIHTLYKKRSISQQTLLNLQKLSEDVLQNLSLDALKYNAAVKIQSIIRDRQVRMKLITAK
jgi:hypothetical protein